MNTSSRLKYLRVALLLFGFIFIFGFWPLTVVWPSGWVWHEEGGSFYSQMMIGLYATLGVFLVIASREPLAHRSLIWFAVWSSIVHAGIMAVQSLTHPEHAGHLVGRRAGAADRRRCSGGPDAARPATHQLEPVCRVQ